MEKGTKLVIPVCVILAAVFCAFSPALKNGFINWDDNVYVTNNLHIRQISPDNIRILITRPVQATYQPVVNLTFLLEHHFFGLRASAYHATNILLHIANCLLVFWLVMLLGESVPVALVAALLFGLHPLRVESVAWVSERKDVLYSFFFLIALVQYCYYVLQRSAKDYFLSLVSFALSLGSKAMAATLPAVLFAVDWFLRRKFDRRLVLEKVPFILLAVVFGILALFAQGAALRVGHGEHYSLSRQVCAALYGVIMYLSKTAFPAGLSLIYPYPPLNTSFYGICAASGVLIAAIIAALFILKNIARKTIFAALFALITVLPVLQLVPVGINIMADRYTYMPSIGLAYIVSIGFFYIYRRSGTLARTALTASLCAVLMALAVATYQRSEVWKDSITVFSDVIAKHPDSYMAYNNRGRGYERANMPDKALADYDRSLQLNDKQVGAYINRGNIYCERRDFFNARSDYEKATQLNPSYAPSFNNLGNVYSIIGRKDDAVKAYKKALEIDPNYAEAYNNLGAEYSDKADAIKMYKKALAINPYYYEACYNLAAAYEALGMKEDAARYREKARQLRPR